MLTNTLKTILTALLGAAIALPSFAHGGRNFDVQIVDDGVGGQRLRLQGYNTNGPEMGVDPAGRPYYGSVHDHFSYLGGGIGALADQPGFHIDNGLTQLHGESLTLQLVGAKKWVVDRDTVLMPGSAMLAAGIGIGDILLEDLGAGEVINANSIANSGDFTTTALLGEIVLTASVTTGPLGYDDVEISYDTTLQANDTLFVIESVLKTSAGGIGDSESFYTILSPDGVDGRERLHFPSLLLEQALGTPVPEPSTLAAVALLPVLMRRRRP